MVVKYLRTISDAYSFPAAKEFVLSLMIKGLRLSEPCDESFSEEDFKLPEWFDEKKYKR